jgi:hypothetical protein
MNEMTQFFVVLPFCIMSALSDVFIIITYVLHPEIHSTYEYQFIFVFSIFNLIQGLATLLPSYLYNSTSFLCTFQGSLIQISSLSGILWAGFISYAMFRDIVHIKQRFAKGFVLPLLVILGISSLSAIVPIFYSAYKLEGAWCWFETPKANHELRGYLFRFLLFYGIVWAVIIMTIATHFSIWYKLKQESVYDLVGMNLLKRLKWYPWILCFAYLPITMFRSFQGKQDISLSIALPCWCLNLLIGFFNGIAFFRSDKVSKIVFKTKSILDDYEAALETLK